MLPHQGLETRRAQKGRAGTDESTWPVSVTVSFSPVQGRPGEVVCRATGRLRTGSNGLGSRSEQHEQTSKASVA